MVRNVFHCALGKVKNVRSSSPPSRRLLTTAGQCLSHVRSKAVYAVRAVSARDYPLILGTILVTATLVLVSNLLADILYATADPRIRLAGKGRRGG